MSLICHKLNLFKHTCDFSIDGITTLDLQLRASHYLKSLLWPKLNWNKIVKIQTRLNVLINNIINKIIQ